MLKLGIGAIAGGVFVAFLVTAPLPSSRAPPSLSLHIPTSTVSYVRAGYVPLQAPLSQGDIDEEDASGEHDGARRERRRNSLPSPTYRTLCVRLCDGYYFPVSFGVRRSQFARDARSCVARCGSGARLFVHRLPNGTVEDMKDLDGRPYDKLASAYLYRTRYIPDCKCQPDPWEAASRERHNGYALLAAGHQQGNGTAAFGHWDGSPSPPAKPADEPTKTHHARSLRSRQASEPARGNERAGHDWRREAFRSQY